MWTKFLLVKIFVILMVGISGLGPSLADSQPCKPSGATPCPWGWDIEVDATSLVGPGTPQSQVGTLFLTPQQTTVTAWLAVTAHPTNWPNTNAPVGTFGPVTFSYSWNSPIPELSNCDSSPEAPHVSFGQTPVENLQIGQTQLVQLVITAPNSNFNWPCFRAQGTPLHITVNGYRTFSLSGGGYQNIPYTYKIPDIFVYVCGVAFLSPPDCVSGRASPELWWDVQNPAFSTKETALLFQAGGGFSTQLLLNNPACCWDTFSNRPMPDTLMPATVQIESPTPPPYTWPVAPNGNVIAHIRILGGSGEPTSIYGLFTAHVSWQCDPACGFPGGGIDFVNLPPSGDEALTKCLPWSGPPDTPAPWGGANATPPQVWQTWNVVQTMITAGWSSISPGHEMPFYTNPFVTTIFLGPPQGDLDNFKQHFPQCITVCAPLTAVDWAITDDNSVPMDQSRIVFNNMATTEGKITGWRSDVCLPSGFLDVGPNAGASMTITDPASGGLGATNTLIFSRKIGQYWYDIGILGEKAFWSMARGRVMTFTWKGQ